MGSLDQPRYRVSDGEPVGICGMARFAGEEFDFSGWPGGRLKPLNPIAEAIANYEKRHRSSAFFPPSPIDQNLGRIFLPGELPNFSPRPNDQLGAGRNAAFVPADQATSEMPRYRLGFGGLTIRGRHLNAGDEVVWIGWPLDFDPLNEAARTITDYFKRHGGHPDLLPAPWCMWAGLVLPELPERPKAPAPAPMTRSSFPVDPDSKALEQALVARAKAARQTAPQAGGRNVE